MFEDLSGDVAFEDAGDLAHGFAFGETAGDVVAGGLVVTHPGDDDVVERRVGLAVPSPVEPVSGRLAGGGRDGSHSAQVSEGGFASDPFGVVAGGDQQLGGGVIAHPEHSQQAGGRFANQGP